MKLRWHVEARAEADAAAAFYREKQPRLAQHFLDDLEEALGRIQRHPQAHRRVEGRYSEVPGAAFPYGVIYRLRPDFIEIIAIMHLRRAPGYWKERR
jgi:plasmid stabilization system protein ParE